MGLKADQSLSDLIRIEAKLRILHLVQAFDSKVANFLIRKPRGQQEQGFDGLEGSPILQCLVSLRYLNRVLPIYGVQVVYQLV